MERDNWLPIRTAQLRKLNVAMMPYMQMRECIA